MSVTFHPELPAPSGFRVGCSCPDNEGPVFGTYADAEAFMKSNRLGEAACYAPEVLEGCDYLGRGGFCEVDSAWIKPVYPNAGPSLNISQGNAVAVLDALGLLNEVEESPLGGTWPVEACGALSADEFLERVLTAQVMSVGDPGRPEEIQGALEGAIIILGGTREGYVDEKLAKLAEIAQWAKDHNREVMWG